MILNRREVVRGIASAPIALNAPSRESRERKTTSKRVIVAGGGIAGLCCAYELAKRRHEVFVLEAAGHVGGHVRTMHDSLADGLYAELGAQHFTESGYDLYWGYVREFNLNAVPAYVSSRPRLRFINGNWFNEEQLRDPVILRRMGFNQREIAFLSQESWGNLPLLYFARYMDAIHDEYHPFHVGLDWLDSLTVTDLLMRDGASDTAVRFIGEKSSALDTVWNAAVLKLRGVPFNPSKKFRIEGGNQKMTDAFGARLGDRVHLGAPVTGIEYGATEVRVSYREFSEKKRMEADYLVCAMSAVMLRQIPVSPAWPDWKAVPINDIPYYTEARVVLQTRDPFWDKDGISSNIDIGAPNLHGVWRSAEEVRTSRALLLSNASVGTTPESALKAFRERYPGASSGIEQVIVWDWSHDPWAMACETIHFKPGDLKRFWPATIKPVGPIHFVGAYADNLWWGQEAATRSANRVAEAIDKA